MEEDIVQEIHGNRPRSRTWPLPQPEEVDESKSHEEEASSKLEGAKKGSRKNAWGNLSYADLITQAITSSPDQRMTLSQIYTWMVENIPYFKDKGDSTSSAGWKNSIRHNLSLHNRFMRIQNEGNGKSSWWILNHDAKCEKTKRRNRSSSLDSDVGVTKIKTNKRGRKATKRSEVDDRPQSPSSKCRGSIAPKSPISGEPSVILEDSPFPFPISDYRHRSSSNTSTVSSIGRLSPIPSHEEEDMQDMPMTMSPVQDHGKTTPTPTTDELVENMKANLNMTIGQAQGNLIVPFRRTCSNEELSNMAVVQQSMNIDSASFVDTRYQPTANGYYSTPNVKQAAFTNAKIDPQNNVYTTEPGIVHHNGIYHVGNTVSPPSQFNIPERPVGLQPYNRPPPTYNQTMIFNNCVVEPKPQQVMNRLAFQTNHCSSNIPVNDTLPMINVDMADSLPVDIDIDYLEGDIQCDVENVLQSELAFNDGCLDFNLDNYVPAITLPELPLHGYVAGSMVH